LTYLILVSQLVHMFSYSHISETAQLNFNKLSLYIDCGFDAVLLWRHCDTLRAFVLWITSCFHTVRAVV